MKAQAKLPVAPNARELRRVLGCYPTGVTVMATRDMRGGLAGLTCNSFTSVSLSPPLVLWCLALYSPSLSAFLEAPYFSVNILSTGQAALSRRFSAQVANRFEGVEHTAGIGGIPLVSNCAANLECRNETRHYVGDHVVFIGHVLRCARSEQRPLVFSEGHYAALA